MCGGDVFKSVGELSLKDISVSCLVPFRTFIDSLLVIVTGSMNQNNVNLKQSLFQLHSASGIVVFDFHILA